MSQFQKEFITTAIEHYGLELEAARVDTVVVSWFQAYDSAWVVKALVESLYRGRYKVKSVDNILKDWQRRGSPFYKFTPDYEREILHSLRLKTDTSTLRPSPVSQPEVELPVSPVMPDREHLNPEESAPFQHHDSLPEQLRQRLILSPHSVTDRVDLDARSAAKLVDSVPLHPSIDSKLEFSTLLNPAVVANSGTAQSDVDLLVTPPTKLHLFNKLRAIVEPTDLRRENIQQSV